MAEPRLRVLTALRRLRRVETDTARRELGEALAQEAGLAERDSAIEREVGAARQFTGDFDRQAFFAWWERMRTERARLANAIRVAAARTEAARATLARRRVAETAAEEALTRELNALAADDARREQIVLEDVARGLRRAAATARGSS